LALTPCLSAMPPQRDARLQASSGQGPLRFLVVAAPANTPRARHYQLKF
jgi:hypothetical protein